MIIPEKDTGISVTVIGPECFASTDGRVICWRGINYYPWASDPEHQPQPAPMPDARRALLDIISEVDQLDEPGPAADWIRMLAEYGLGERPHPDGDAERQRRPAPCGHPANEDGECDCSSWPERAPMPTGDSDNYRPGGYLPDADGPAAAPGVPVRLFRCCEHCTHDPSFEPDRHESPCHQGCDLAHAGAEVTFVAFGNGSVNDLGADAGLSVFRKVTEAGQVMEGQQVAEWTGVDVDGEGGELDTEAAAKQLGYLGWRITGAGWRAANDGQMVIEVEPWDDGRDVAGALSAQSTCEAAPTDLFACCEHCEHDPDYEPDRHTIQCPEGCNDPVA